MGGSSSKNLTQKQISEPRRPTYATYEPRSTYEPPSVRNAASSSSNRPNYESLNWHNSVRESFSQQQLINQLTRDFGFLKINSSRQRVQAPERSVRNPSLLNVSRFLETQIYTLTPLSPNDYEYTKITSMITNKKNFKVDSIEKIENPYLEKAYQLKRAQKQSQYFGLEELLLFHGTKRMYVDDICRNNFNWRRCQTHKYGKGVSFSPNSTYASVYSDKNVYQKVMIVAKVIIGSSCIGHENMDIPPEGCDTSQKGQERIVVVKYEDNDFYPVYKINYHVKDENIGRGNRYNRNKRRNRITHEIDLI